MSYSNSVCCRNFTYTLANLFRQAVLNCTDDRTVRFWLREKVLIYSRENQRRSLAAALSRLCPFGAYTMIQQVQTLVGVPTHLDPKAVAELAIVIPVYKQPGLLLEALESVIAQRTRHVVRVVVVDDGCPFPQTGANAQAYAAAYPGAIVYLRRVNGGL